MTFFAVMRSLSIPRIHLVASGRERPRTPDEKGERDRSRTARRSLLAVDGIDTAFQTDHREIEHLSRIRNMVNNLDPSPGAEFPFRTPDV